MSIRQAKWYHESHEDSSLCALLSAGVRTEAALSLRAG